MLYIYIYIYNKANYLIDEFSCLTTMYSTLAKHQVKQILNVSLENNK